MKTRAIPALFAAAFVTACISGSDFRPVPFQAFAWDSDFSSGPDRAIRTAVDNATEWKKLWKEVLPHLPRDADNSEPPSLPPIDFSKFTLVVAAMGEMPSSGYFVAIQSVVESRWDLRVTVLEVHPGGNCAVLTALTRPIALVLVPRTDKPFSFDVIRSESRCE